MIWKWLGFDYQSKLRVTLLIFLVEEFYLYRILAFIDTLSLFFQSYHSSHRFLRLIFCILSFKLLISTRVFISAYSFSQYSIVLGITVRCLFILGVSVIGLYRYINYSINVAIYWWLQWINLIYWIFRFLDYLVRVVWIRVIVCLVLIAIGNVNFALLAI